VTGVRLRDNIFVGKYPLVTAVRHGSVAELQGVSKVDNLLLS
jgi:hypothetical protein